MTHSNPTKPISSDTNRFMESLSGPCGLAEALSAKIHGNEWRVTRSVRINPLSVVERRKISLERGVFVRCLCKSAECFVEFNWNGRSELLGRMIRCGSILYVYVK